MATYVTINGLFLDRQSAGVGIIRMSCNLLHEEELSEHREIYSLPVGTLASIQLFAETGSAARRRRRESSDGTMPFVLRQFGSLARTKLR